jgi:uncharacterized membrane protein
MISLALFLSFFAAGLFIHLEQVAAAQANSPTTQLATSATAVDPADGEIPGEYLLEPERQQQEFYEKAIVLEVNSIDRDPSETAQNRITEQTVKVRMLSGTYKGQDLLVTNNLTGSPGIDIIVEPGDKIVLYMTAEIDSDGRAVLQNVYVADRLRSPALLWLTLIFTALILIIGRYQGLKALLGLGVTALGIYKILLPGLLAGKPALPLTIMVLVGATLITMVFIAGFSRKAIAATLGTVGGLIAAGLLAYLFGGLAQLSGLSTEEERMLLYVNNITIDIRGLLFSGILIGALGAIMDVAMSVASTISEVKKADPSMKAYQLMGAGMNVGRDIMGTMANTLILAYTGSALPLMLLFMAYKMEPISFLNWEMITTEIVRALVGSIGLIACIPFTALIAGWLNGSGKIQALPYRAEDA